MRKLVICLAILSISFKCIPARVAKKQESSESSEDFETLKRDAAEVLKEIDNFFKESCEKLGGTDAYLQFLQAKNTLENCLIENRPKDYELPSKICKEKRPALRSCIEKAIPAVGNCLDGSLKWLVQDFFPGSFNSVLEYNCGNIFFSLKELMSLEGMDCIVNIAKDSIAFDNTTDICLDKALDPLDKEFDEITKGDLCKGLNIYETCLTKAIRDECPLNRGVEHLVQGFIDAVKQPCSALEVEDLNSV